MANHHAGNITIENPGTLKSASTMLGIFAAFAVIGVATFLYTLSTDVPRAWTSFLAGRFYFMGLSVLAVFFLAISWITTTIWAVPVRRLAESFTAYLPVVVVSLLLLILVGAPHIYPWTHADHVKGDVILEAKAGYLNLTFFLIRSMVAITAWILFARKLVKGSLSLDTGANYWDVWGTSRKFSTAFLAIFALSFTMMSIDQLKSLDPHWFSTMFGVNVFGGFFQCFFALLAIVAIRLKKSGYLGQVFNENHLHDIAKMMFAFTVFWAYTWFSQYMLIWYANLPEETGYFLLRFNEGWEKITIFLFVGKFVIPFLALLPRANKRTESLVFAAAVWILGMQFVELNWFIQPQFHADGLHIGFQEVGTWLGFLGFFGIAVTLFMKKHSVLAWKDATLPKAVLEHHQ